MTDDLDRLLGPPAGDPNPDLREVIRRRTGRGVRRRRWVRVGGNVLTAVGLFVAGLAVGSARVPAPPDPPPPEVIAVPVLVPVRPPAPPPPENPYLTADRLEQDAERTDDRAEAARLYRLAGDKYLTDAAEPGQAARCYRLHLRYAGPAGRTVEPADSWLLMSLKSSHTQGGG